MHCFVKVTNYLQEFFCSQLLHFNSADELSFHVFMKPLATFPTSGITKGQQRNAKLSESARKDMTNLELKHFYSNTAIKLYHLPRDFFLLVADFLYKQLNLCAL